MFDAECAEGIGRVEHVERVEGVGVLGESVAPRRPILLWAAEPLRPLRGFGKTPTVDVLATAPRLRTFQP